MHFKLPEAIVLARDTYKQIQIPGKAEVSVQALVRYAESVETAANAGDPPFRIQVMSVEATKVEMRGMWVRRATDATIYVSRELNQCWQRFVICKEALHLLVDREQGAYAKSIPEQIKDAYNMVWPRTAQAELTSEQFAAIAAFELLYPWGLRKPVSEPPSPMLEEAKKFRIPELYLDSYFRVDYGRVSEEMNHNLNA